MSAFWRRNVDLPAMFGPVSSQMRPELRVARRRQIAIVGDERIADRLLDHRMAAALDDEVERAVDVRANIGAFDRKRRKPARNIEHGQRLGGGLDLVARGDRRGRELLEHLKLEVERAVGGVGDFRFELAELGGGESDLAGQGLAVNEGRVERRAQKLLAVLGGDVDKIAEHVIVPYLQSLNAGVVGVAGLQLRHHLAGFVAQRARFIERRVISRRG